MCKLILFLYLILLSFSANTQNRRFLYIDSFNAYGTSPFTKEYIKNNKIRYVAAYHYYSKKKDSSLFKKYMFDTSGNLTGQILYGPTGRIIPMDSIIYDNQNRKTEIYLSLQDKFILSSSFHYTGDSIINTTFYYMTVNKKIDTSYFIEYLNPNKQPIYVSYTDVKNKEASHSIYTYTDQGLPATMEFTDLLPSNMSYGYIYEHQFSKNGRTMKLWDSRFKNKLIRAECFYNTIGQCIKCVDHARTDYSNTFHYYPDGAIFEEIFEYTSYIGKPTTIVSRYFYYQTP